MNIYSREEIRSEYDEPHVKIVKKREAIFRIMQLVNPTRQRTPQSAKHRKFNRK